MKKLTYTLIISIMAFATCALQGDTIINWGGTGMATADNNLSLPTATDSATTRTWEYSATTSLLATGGTYAGPTIYGALQAQDSTGPVNFGSAKVDDRGANPDSIYTTLSAAGAQIRGLVFFKKADFSNLSSGTISFDSTSSATFSIYWNNGAGSGRGQRLAVLDGSSWYVSSSVFGGANGTLTISDLSTENFAAYDPTGAPLAGTPTSFTTAGSTFTDIQAVGYYFDLGISTSTKAELGFYNFEVTAIPEPATLGMIAATGALLLVFRRRMQI